MEKPTEGLGFNTTGGGFITPVDVSEDVFLSSIQPGETVLEVDATQKSKKVNPTGKNPKNYCSPPTIKPHQYPHVSTSQNFYFFYLWFEKPEQ